MPVQVVWYEAPHVIAVFWVGKISAEDMEYFVNELKVMLPKSVAPVFILNDLGEVTLPFMNMGLIRNFLRDTMNDERIEWLLGYRVNTPIITFLVKFVSRLFSLNARTFDCWEDAQDFLQSLDTGLDFSRTPTAPATMR